MQIIMQKNAGLIIPEGLVRKVFALPILYFGTMYREASGIITDKYTDIPSADDFMEAQEQNKDAAIVFFFSKTALSPESQQPFKIAEEGENVRLAMMLEGEYFNNDKAESAHSGEYHSTENIIKPLIQQNLQYASGDLVKCFDVMRPGQLGEKLINQSSVNRGCVVLLGDNGEILWIEKGNSLGGSFEWGKVSNRLGYTEGKEAASEPEKPKGFLKKATERIADVVSLTSKKENAGSTIKDENNKTDSAIPKDVIRPMIRPPEKVKSKSSRGQWYDNNCTCRPKNWETGLATAPANDLWMKANAAKFVPLQEGLQGLKDKVSGSDAKPSEHTEQYKPFVPIITPTRKSALQSLIDSAAVQAQLGKARVLKPEELREDPAYETFTKQMGWNLEDTFRMDRGILHLIGKNDLESLVMLAAEYRDACMALLAGGTDEDVGDGSDAIVEPAPTETPVSAPAVVTKPASGMKGASFMKKQRLAN